MTFLKTDICFRDCFFAYDQLILKAFQKLTSSFEPCIIVAVFLQFTGVV